MSKTKAPTNPLLEPKRRRIPTGVVVTVVLVLALGAGVGVQYWRGHSGVSVADGAAAEPAVITSPGTDGKGVTLGREGAEAHIDLYLDYRCPHCKDFEDEAGPVIDKLVDDGEATVTYHPLGFVNKEASPRLANAFACAAVAGKARSYSGELYASFEKSWSADQLLELGRLLGIDDQGFDRCVTGNGQAAWLDTVAKAADARGVTGTPTAFVDGRRLDGDKLSAEGIQAAVDAGKTGSPS